MRRSQGQPLKPRPLTDFTRERLDVMFGPEDRPEVERVLTVELVEVQPDRSGLEMERFQCAVLRVSGGSLAGLRQAVQLAREDWRDLLMAARFFEPPYFRSWKARHFNDHVAQDWLKGTALPGVALFPGDRVIVARPGHRERMGTVEALLGLEPAVRYRVQLEPEGTVDVWQSSLRRRETSA